MSKWTRVIFGVIGLGCLAAVSLIATGTPMSRHKIVTVRGTIAMSADISAWSQHAAEVRAQEAQRIATEKVAADAAARRARQTSAKTRASRGGTVVRLQAVYAEVDGMPGLLRRIGGCESSGAPEAPINWTAQNKTSTASGGFQIIDSTWRGWTKVYAPDVYGMYVKARLAPPEVQLRVARAAFERQGTDPWKSSRRCWS